MSRIGIIEQIWRYPVKSMRGEALEQAQVGFTGIVGDRVWAFVAAAPKQADFPWHTAREQPELLLYTPRFRDPIAVEAPYPDAAAFQVDVTSPEGDQSDLQAPALLAELLERSGKTFKLRFSEKGAPDARPLALLSHATLQALAAETGRELTLERFRPNFYVRWDDPRPFYEDELVGRRLGIGDRLEIEIVKKDPRCVIITLDPTTAEAHPDVLKNVARRHGGCTGVYAAVLREGKLARGMEIRLLP